MGLRARLTQLLSLVGKTLLSDTIPEHEAKKVTWRPVVCLYKVECVRNMNALLTLQGGAVAGVEFGLGDVFRFTI